LSKERGQSGPHHYSGGCLCGALRYQAEGPPLYAGYCFCTDCQKISGSGFVPFMGVASATLRFSGPSQAYISRAIHGGDATRNFCPTCSGLVFGGVRGLSDSYTIYAGSLDDVAVFEPTIAIFARSRPAWVPLPPGLKLFEAMPP
jgi:hypothetical protein